jgi:hypothetical protein
MKALNALLDSDDYVFALEMAVLASRRDVLNLEKWLPDFIAKDSDSTVAALANFIHRKVEVHLGPNPHIPLEQGSLLQIVSVRSFLKTGPVSCACRRVPIVHSSPGSLRSFAGHEERSTKAVDESKTSAAPRPGSRSPTGSQLPSQAHFGAGGGAVACRH